VALRLHVPFCDDFEREHLKHLKAGLRRLSVLDVRRALALVLALLLRLHAVDILLLRAIEWNTRAALAHAAMLRQDDHSDDLARALLLSSVRAMLSCLFTLYVGEGKNQTRRLQSAMIWNSFEGESPGYWLEHYLALVRADSRPRSDFLFPLVRDDGSVDWSRPAPKSAFIREARRRARVAGLHEAAVERITGHSFRAGGVTDLLLAGFSPDFIMKQGRWLSLAYTVYFRMSEAALGAMSAQLLRRMATRTAAYLGAAPSAAALQERLFR
jgi:hypothetical protein